MRLQLHKNLGPLRGHAIVHIEEDAAKMRMKVITTTPGQDQVYARKLAQAKAVLQGATEAPALKFEADLAGITLQEQAQIVVDRAEACNLALDEIEKRRMIAKRAVAEAGTPAEIEAASHIDWTGFKHA